MKILENYPNISFGEYIEELAINHLTDVEYELEYQGLYIKDKCFYLSNKIQNLMPLYYQNNNQ